MDLKVGATFGYDQSMQRDVQNKRKVQLSDVPPPYASDKEEDADDNMSRNTAALEMTGVGDENSAMNLWPG